jgi:hypothetical protein
MVITPRRVMTDEHKEAIKLSRIRSAAVRRFLESNQTQPKKRGRKRTVASITAKIERLKQDIANPGTSPINKLNWIAQSKKLEAELEKIKKTFDPEVQAEIERDFIEHAKGYGESRGIQKAAWLEIGVSPEMLAKAGIQ